MVYAWDNLPKFLLETSKSCYSYSGYEISFHGKGNLNFGNDFAGDVLIFGADNGSSSHTDNCKNAGLVLDEEDIFGINVFFGAPKKTFSTYCSKAKIDFAWVYTAILIIVICLLTGNKCISLKKKIKM